MYNSKYAKKNTINIGMKHILALTLILLSTNSAADCVTLTEIIETAQQAHGFVAPVSREDVIKLTQLRVLPKKVLGIADHIYVEILEGSPMVRLFSMKRGCADLQWMLPRDFLILLGWKTANLYTDAG